MVGLIREMPGVRVIDFMGVRIEFIPHAGTYWISRGDIEAASGVDVGEAQAFRRSCPKWYDQPKADAIECQEQIYRIGGYYSLRTASYALRCSHARGDEALERVVALLGVIAAIPASLVSNFTHTAIDQRRLKMLIERHPHWIDVLEMWNKGHTEKQIADALGSRVTLVRSAVLQLRRHGFEVMRRRLREMMH